MKIYKTSHWTFTPSKQELVYNNNSVKQLPSRLSKCLEALLEAEGNILLYDDLLKVVWGTLYRDSNTIASVISELRKFINCGESQLKYIITVPKKGYRFNNYEQIELLASNKPSNAIEHTDSVAETNGAQDKIVSEDAAELASDVSSSTGVDSAPMTEQPVSLVKNEAKPMFKLFSYGLGKFYIALFFLFCILVILSVEKMDLLSFTTSTDDAAHRKYAQATILTHEQGRELDFSVSNDQHWLAYVSERGEEKDIVLTDLSSDVQSSLKAIVGEKYTSPSFSPEGTALAYIVNGEGFCNIYQTHFNAKGFISGDQRLITECGVAGSWMTISYSNDGESLFFVKSSSTSEPYRLYKHDLKTGYERSITSPTSSGRGDYSFALSPDGSTIAFIRNELWEKSTVLLFNISTGETKKAFNVPELMNTITWEGNNNLLYTSKNAVYRFNLEQQDVEIAYQYDKAVNFPLNRQHHLYLTRGNLFKSNIWQLNTKNQSVNSLISNDYIDKLPTNSGDSLYFVSDRTGTPSIWHKSNGREKLIFSNDELEHTKNLVDFDEQHLLGLLSGRIVKIDKETGIIEWLSPESKKIFSFSLDKNKNTLTYATELNEAWFVEQLDVVSKRLELLGVQGFTAKSFNGMLLLSQFRKPGLWLYDPKTRKRRLYIKDFETFSANKWAISGDFIVALEKGNVKLYQHDGVSGELTNVIHVDGNPRSIVCSSTNDTCNFDLYTSGSSEIIRLDEDM